MDSGAEPRQRGRERLEHLFLGVDIGGTAAKVGVIDAEGELHAVSRVETGPELEPDDLINEIFSCGRELLGRLGAHYGELVAAGVGCAGLVNTRAGVLVTSPNLAAWENVPLRELLGSAIDVEVYLDNDANAFAYAEAKLGAARGKTDGVFLTLGTGVGGGLLLGGQIYRGCNGFGAELGHVVIDPDGPVCQCGNRGCLESFVRSRTIVENAVLFYRKAGKAAELERIAGGDVAALTPELLSAAAASGDELAARVFRETGRWIGVAVGGFINAFNPQVVVIGGGVAEAGELLFEPIRHWAGRYAFSASYNSASILPACLGENAGLIGAALEARDRCGIPCK